MKAVDEFRKILEEAQKPKVDPKSPTKELREILIEAQKAKANQHQETSSIHIEESHVVNLDDQRNIVEVNEETDFANLTAKYLDKGATLSDPSNIESQRWNDPLRRNPDEKFVTTKELKDHYGQFLNRIQQQLSSLGGGGEVKFRYLDDVNRFTMTNDNNNHLLEYDVNSGKVQFTNKIGPIDRINFDLNHVHDEERVVGTLCWSQQDQTLNIEHPDGVTQQVGQELYVKVRNRTGSTIANGTVVQFAGAEQNGTARLLVAPFLGDGTFPNLYGLGITTQDIVDGDDGFVTVWGKIRELDTSAFNVGDILYVSPTVPGGMVNVKPTAPNNVMPVAAVLRKDATEGEIFVRPTIEQRNFYGSFVDKSNHVAALPNTPYPIPVSTVEFSSGVIHKVDDNLDKSKIQVLQSGLYNFQFSTQFVSSNSSAKDVYVWARKNGNNIPDSSTRLSVVGNGVYFVASWNFVVSMDANDYFQLMWAASDTTVSITAPPATSFAPATPSTLLSVTRVAQ